VAAFPAAGVALGAVLTTLIVAMVRSTVVLASVRPGSLLAGAGELAEVMLADTGPVTTGRAGVEPADVCVISPAARCTVVDDGCGFGVALAGEVAVWGTELVADCFVGHVTITIREIVGAGASGALIAGTGSVMSVESGRGAPLAAGRTLSDGIAAMADSAVARITCSITAGGQRGSVNVRWNQADVPSMAQRSDDPTRRRYRVKKTTRLR
jgi:hypothetical protein